MNHSKDFNLRALSLAAAMLMAGASASAQSSVQAYGLIDASIGSFQNAGSAKVKRLDSGNMSTSYLGFKGSEDLGGGLRANFALDSFLLVDSGGATRVPGVDAFWARNAWVGVSGGFGSTRLGRMGTPLFVSTLIFNAWGDSFGFSPSIRQYFIAPYGTPVVGDTGWSNTLAYATPNMGGLSANVHVALGEKGANSKGNNVGANVMYFAGPVALTGAWQSVKTQGTLGRPISAFPGFAEQTAWQLAGTYDLKAVKFFAQYGEIETDATADVTTKNTQLGVSVPVGQGKFLAAYGLSKIATQRVTAKKESKMMTVGYDYNLSKRTDVYGLYMSDKFTGLASGTTLAVGIRHTF